MVIIKAFFNACLRLWSINFGMLCNAVQNSGLVSGLSKSNQIFKWILEIFLFCEWFYKWQIWQNLDFHTHFTKGTTLYYLCVEYFSQFSFDPEVYTKSTNRCLLTLYTVLNEKKKKNIYKFFRKLFFFQNTCYCIK